MDLAVGAAGACTDATFVGRGALNSHMSSTRERAWMAFSGWRSRVTGEVTLSWLTLIGVGMANAEWLATSSHVTREFRSCASTLETDTLTRETSRPVRVRTWEITVARTASVMAAIGAG